MLQSPSGGFAKGEVVFTFVVLENGALYFISVQYRTADYGWYRTSLAV
jgi:hypothetical protein